MSTTDPKYCGKCIYYGQAHQTCDYWDMTDMLRGCPAGQGCTCRKIGTKRLRGQTAISINNRRILAAKDDAAEPNREGW